MAKILAEKVLEIPKITITKKVESNGVFARIPREYIFQEEFFFYMCDEEHSEVRKADPVE